MGSLRAAGGLLCLVLLLCAAHFPADAITTVPALNYELVRLATNHDITHVTIIGCHSVRRFSLPSANVTFLCTHTEGCEQELLQKGSGTGSIKFQCWRDEAAPKATEPSALLVLDSTSCENGFCPARVVLAQQQAAFEGGYRYFAMVDWMAHALQIVNLTSHTISQFVEGGSARNVFSQIYDRNSWGPEGEGSGPGSTLEATASVRNIISGVIANYSVSSMIDAPCGSMHWMPKVLDKLGDSFRYAGMDVACPVIRRHYGRFYDHPNWRFYCADICHQDLLRGYDMVFSRDALQHLPFSYIFGFLRNVKRSGAKYLLVGSYLGGANRNIPVGEYFMINLLQTPFNLPKPIAVFEETTSSAAERKSMLLFDVATLPDFPAGPPTLTRR